MPKLPTDFQDLLRSLNAHSVEYVVVGGYAVSRYGHPRLTGDLDILIRPNEGNVERLLAALDAFGTHFDDLSVDDLLAPRRVVQIGFPPLRVDLITAIDGVENDEVFAERVLDVSEGLEVYFIGLRQLLKNKRAVDRPKDRADVAYLEGLSHNGP